MERLWSPADATSGNQRQIATARDPLKQVQSVASGCQWLPETSNGKEGSPVRVRQRALQKPRKSGLFRKRSVLVGWLDARCGALYGAVRRVKAPFLSSGEADLGSGRCRDRPQAPASGLALLTGSSPSLPIAIGGIPCSGERGDRVSPRLGGEGVAEVGVERASL